ncbi:unnamed protein product [Protopolystoma xenopodis]|uniref:PIN domain-containing protein n=1 Tax=Protopolystoma xenopodis TaxID=117903 RepID=A0A448X6N6_9PLAT|nr:unnamed protein product [Protopolystoma xenopodis]
MPPRRVKRLRDLLHHYHRVFGLKLDPLEIFLDYTFVRQALLNKLNIFSSFNCLVGSDVKLVTSSCVVEECRQLGDLCTGTVKILLGYKILKCRHDYNPTLGASRCIIKRLETAKKIQPSRGNMLFALATNDCELRSFAETVPGFPVFFISHRCINSQPIPPGVSLIIDAYNRSSSLPSREELGEIREAQLQFGYRNECTLFKRKAPIEANTLSCKKRKASLGLTDTPVATGRHRPSRKRIKKTWAFLQALSHFEKSDILSE